jgi:hypothetical protein
MSPTSEPGARLPQPPVTIGYVGDYLLLKARYQPVGLSFHDRTNTLSSTTTTQTPV